jgi:hypothetical protein
MILGVESSCDESAFALFDAERGLRGEWIHSQIARHQPYGGVVPDLASREHLDHFPPLLEEVVASGRLGEVREIAVTSGPGLAGSLALGMEPPSRYRCTGSITSVDMLSRLLSLCTKGIPRPFRWFSGSVFRISA